MMILYQPINALIGKSTSTVVPVPVQMVKAGALTGKSTPVAELALAPVPYEQRPCRWDVGVIQADALGADPAATLEALEEVERALPDQLEREAAWLVAQGEPALVLGDVPPAAARLAAGGGEAQEFTPVELFLTAMAACSATDVDFITSRIAECDQLRIFKANMPFFFAIILCEGHKGWASWNEPGMVEHDDVVGR